MRFVLTMVCAAALGVVFFPVARQGIDDFFTSGEEKDVIKVFLVTVLLMGGKTAARLFLGKHPVAYDIGAAAAALYTFWKYHHLDEK